MTVGGCSLVVKKGVRPDVPVADGDGHPKGTYVVVTSLTGKGLDPKGAGSMYLLVGGDEAGADAEHGSVVIHGVKLHSKLDHLHAPIDVTGVVVPRITADLRRLDGPGDPTGVVVPKKSIVPLIERLVIDSGPRHLSPSRIREALARSAGRERELGDLFRRLATTSAHWSMADDDDDDGVVDVEVVDVADADEVREQLDVVFERHVQLQLLTDLLGLKDVDEFLGTLMQAAVAAGDPAHLLPAAELDALAEAGIDLVGKSGDPTGAIQVALGASRFAQFRAEALSVKEAAKELRLTAGRVRQLITNGDAVAFVGDDGNYLMPRWQFHDGALVPGLRQFAEVISAAHPFTLAAFMTRPDPDLEVGVDGEPASPVEWLVGGGDPEVVADLALRLVMTP